MSDLDDLEEIPTGVKRAQRKAAVCQADAPLSRHAEGRPHAASTGGGSEVAGAQTAPDHAGNGQAPAMTAQLSSRYADKPCRLCDIWPREHGDALCEQCRAGTRLWLDAVSKYFASNKTATKSSSGSSPAENSILTSAGEPARATTELHKTDPL